jgi:hypothetical protein
MDKTNILRAHLLLSSKEKTLLFGTCFIFDTFSPPLVYKRAGIAPTNPTAVCVRSQRVFLPRFQLIYSKTGPRAMVARFFQLLGPYRLISTAMRAATVEPVGGRSVSFTYCRAGCTPSANAHERCQKSSKVLDGTGGRGRRACATRIHPCVCSSQQFSQTMQKKTGHGRS